MSPDEGHRRARRTAEEQLTVWDIWSVPDLFWKQMALIGAGLQGGEECPSRIGPTSRQLVVGSLASEQRPWSTDSCPVESAAVFVLTISILVVPTPQRSEWR